MQDKKLRTCRKCGEPKELTLFPKYKTLAGNPSRRHVCQKCRTYASCKIKKHNQYYLRRYGLTQEDYQDMLYNQDFRCAICRRDHIDAGSTSIGDFLHVDHRHSDGKVRELLCSKCNHAVGDVRENPIIAIRVAEYLIKHNGLPKAA